MARYVHKLQASVLLSRPDEEALEGYLSLSPRAESHDGPETLLDLLNSSARFIPFVPADGGPVLLLARLQLDWIMPGPEVPADVVRPSTYLVTREERVGLRFTDGRRIEGLIQMELPEELNRASDFLNGPGDFFPLLTDFGILLLNKATVRETEVFESSPAPAGMER